MKHNNDILPDDYQDKELDEYRLGIMRNGLGIDCDLDENLVFKFGQFNLILGHDNVGKTFFMLWYFTVLSVKHELTWTLYCAENEIWSVKNKIISFYCNQNIKTVEESTSIKAKSWVANHFNFIDNTKLYSLPDLLKNFETQDSAGFLIDPYNSLSKDGNGSHEYEYEMASLVRIFTRKFNKTVYINMHPVTEASRIKHKEGRFKGNQAPPMKSHAEGGTKWPSRCDDFIVLHRYWISGMEKTTAMFVEKIKETDTGGKRTLQDEFLMFDFKEYRFSINGKNPLTQTFEVSDRQLDTISPNGGMSSLFEDHEKDLEQIPDPEADIPF